MRPKWKAMSKQRIDVFLPFQDHKICVHPSSQRGSSQGKLLFIHCLGWMAQFRYSLVVRKRTWKKEINNLGFCVELGFLQESYAQISIFCRGNKFCWFFFSFLCLGRPKSTTVFADLWMQKGRHPGLPASVLTYVLIQHLLLYVFCKCFYKPGCI